MKFYLAIVDKRRVLCSTQAEAKELDPKYERHDIPVDHDGLKAFVQDLYDQIGFADRVCDMQSDALEKAAELPVEAPPPPPAAKPAPDMAEIKRKLALELRGMQTEAIEEKIAEAKAGDLGRFLHASVCRLGELGRAGYEAFVGYRTFGGDVEAPVGGKKQRSFIPGADERGLRYLALMQVDDILGRKRAPADTADA